MLVPVLIAAPNLNRHEVGATPSRKFVTVYNALVDSYFLTKPRNPGTAIDRPPRSG